MDRLLAASTLAYQSVTAVIQVLVVFSIAYAGTGIPATCSPPSSSAR